MRIDIGRWFIHINPNYIPEYWGEYVKMPTKDLFIITIIIFIVGIIFGWLLL